jgi:hypothetical protein
MASIRRIFLQAAPAVHVERGSTLMKTILTAAFFVFSVLPPVSGAVIEPSRTEVITPAHIDSFNLGGKAKPRKQGGNPRTIQGCLVFDGSQDGDRQVDPQIAVGGNYVLHGTNHGLVIYDKAGHQVMGVHQRVFEGRGGIDPKLFFDPNNRVFGFDYWNLWDRSRKDKPVNVSVSETADPTGAWNTYPVPAADGRDGGAIGYSRKWIGYNYPSKSEKTFILSMADAKTGKPTTIYHFKENFGQPAYTQDPLDDLYFLKLTGKDIVITRVHDDGKGRPVAEVAAQKPHGFKHFGWPPKAPQKGTDKTNSSGDRNPKNLVLQSGCLWFSHVVNIGGRAAVQWHQVKPDGTVVQSGAIAHPKHSYIQTTIAVNKQNDVLVGFQEAGPDMFVSPRLALRHGTDPQGTLRAIIKLGEGKAATKGGPWGDYSGSVVDGDNLLDLWTIQSIANEKGRGATVIAKVPVVKEVEKKKEKEAKETK